MIYNKLNYYLYRQVSIDRAFSRVGSLRKMVVEISQSHPTPWPLVHPIWIPQSFKPYHLDVFVGENGASDQVQHESQDATIACEVSLSASSSPLLVGSCSLLARLRYFSYNLFIQEIPTKPPP